MTEEGSFATVTPEGIIELAESDLDVLHHPDWIDLSFDAKQQRIIVTPLHDSKGIGYRRKHTRIQAHNFARHHSLIQEQPRHLRVQKEKEKLVLLLGDPAPCPHHMVYASPVVHHLSDTALQANLWHCEYCGALPALSAGVWTPSPERSREENLADFEVFTSHQRSLLQEVPDNDTSDEKDAELEKG